MQQLAERDALRVPGLVECQQGAKSRSLEANIRLRKQLQINRPEVWLLYIDELLDIL